MFIHGRWNLFDEYFVQQRLLLLARAIEREMARDLQAAFRLTVAEWRVLAFICTAGPSIAATICAEYDSDPAEVCRAVARLGRAQLVAREPDARHQRKMRIMPTAAGQALFERVHAMGEAYFTGLTRDLSTDDRDSTNRALDCIARRVEERRARTAGGPD